MAEKSVIIEQREAPVLGRFDVVVAGGGSAGLAAAVSSARNGARTALVERYGFLGGNAVSAYVGTICGLYYETDSGIESISAGFAGEWARRLAEAGGGMGPVPFKSSAVFLYVPWLYKVLADSIVRDEPLLEVFLHAPMSDVYVGPSGLEGVIISTKQGPRALLAQVFVDATGDADLAFFADDDVVASIRGERQFPSMQFIMGNVDFEAARAAAIADLGGEALDVKAISGAVTGMLSRLLATIGQESRWDMGRTGGAVFPTFRPGEVIGAMTRIRDADGNSPDLTDVRATSRAEMSGRDEVLKAHAFLKENLPGFSESFVVDTPTQLGVRETRRVRGRYVLTSDDVLGAGRFDDAIGCGAWPQEFHWKGKETEYNWLERGAYYQMPYSMLLSNRNRNLLIAGRCASADPRALASTRVIATSMVQGEAAGTAAALCVGAGISPEELDLAVLRTQLADQGAFLG